MTLVPAVMMLLGDRAWWLPDWLDRRLPVLDVEGAGIEKHVEHDEWVAEHGPAVLRAEKLRLEADGAALFDDVDVVLREGDLLAVRSRDAVARRALLATVSGRLDADSGRLVVLGRVLPAESGAVRRRVALYSRFPSVGELERLRRAAQDGPTLLVLDDLDGRVAGTSGSPDRWDVLRELAADGVTVLVGCSDAVPRSLHLLDLDDPGRSTCAAPNPRPLSETTPEEATL